MIRMTDEEMNQASSSLKAWFHSQDIMPADAGIVMIKLIAEQFVAKSRDINSLQTAISLLNTLAAIEVAAKLRETAK